MLRLLRNRLDRAFILARKAKFLRRAGDSICGTIFASLALLTACTLTPIEPPPQPEVSEKAATAEAPAEPTATSLGIFEATAYNADCHGCSGITATGVDVRSSTQHNGRTVVAVDPAVIPLGTALIVELADGTEIEAVAADTGGAIDGRRVDILFASRQAALDFGRQDVEVRKGSAQ
ncbi:3D domain-containing protein [Salibacterium aidingense]|uniref:3D domain-containing protein n=1 Tax=Salibacterium aidingense TaxID=384933 RepID=UPI003BDDBE6A